MTFPPYINISLRSSSSSIRTHNIAEDGPYCERYTFSGSVCYSIGEIGIDYVYFNSSVGTLDQYNSSLLQLLTAAMTFKMAECQDMFKELLCMNSFPRCDLSTATPRPLQVEGCGDERRRVVEVEMYREGWWSWRCIERGGGVGEV